ncbi:hypothetical protein TNCT_613981 [Trichonephila clavata]|uniref:Secreted protein n=1 Tax=Trichonephila clavata TaxID=2740835 RepID=A0A8X6GJB9_TRICU|nr:hypothetical protein TNCT_613981 [Trichonephila clavata]
MLTKWFAFLVFFYHLFQIAIEEKTLRNKQPKREEQTPQQTTNSPARDYVNRLETIACENSIYCDISIAGSDSGVILLSLLK